MLIEKNRINVEIPPVRNAITYDNEIILSALLELMFLYSAKYFVIVNPNPKVAKVKNIEIVFLN